MDNFKPDGQPSSFSVKYELETTAARQIASVAATSIARGQEALEKLYHPVVPPDDKTLELERGLQSIMFGCFKSGTGPVVDGEHPAHLFTKLVGDVSSKDFHLPGRPPDASQLLAWAARKETLQVSTSSGTDKERLVLCLSRARSLPEAKPEKPETSPVDKHHSVFHFTRPPDSGARIFSKTLQVSTVSGPVKNRFGLCLSRAHFCGIPLSTPWSPITKPSQSRRSATIYPPFRWVTSLPTHLPAIKPVAEIHHFGHQPRPPDSDTSWAYL